MGANYHYATDRRVIEIIKRKAKKLIGKCGFQKSDQEDIIQDLLQDFLERIPHYDPRKGQITTFADRVTTHKVCTIIESRTAGIRDHRRCQESLNQYHEDRDGIRTEQIDIISQDDYLSRTGRPIQSEDGRNLSIDLQKALSELPLDLRPLFENLASEKTITEISRALKIPRGTLYDALKRLRIFFEERGLGDYL